MPYVIRVLGPVDPQMIAPHAGRYFLVSWNSEEVHCTSQPREAMAFDSKMAAEIAILDRLLVRHKLEAIDLDEARKLVLYRCDFCSENVTSGVVFDAQNFELVEALQITPRSGPLEYHETSVRGWLACEICEPMVRSENREGLVRRSARKAWQEIIRRGMDGAVDRDMIRQGIRGVQQGFWDHRTGIEQQLVEGELVD